MRSELYKVGDSVECQFKGVWYEARVRKIDEKKAKAYYIHYCNWNHRYDHWVSASSLRLPQRAKRSASSTQEAPSRKKVKAEEAVEEEKRKGVKINLPRELKAQLVYGWEQICLEPRKLIPLPREPCVSTILDVFVKSRGGNRENQKKWNDFATAFLIYFDKALNKLLLFRPEREQYAKLQASFQEKPSMCYGAEHLIRLLAKFPEILAATDMSPSEVSQTKTKLADLCKYLVSEKTSLFLAHYELNESISSTL